METNLISLISYNIFCFMIIIDIIYNMNFVGEQAVPKTVLSQFLFPTVSYLLYSFSLYSCNLPINSAIDPAPTCSFKISMVNSLLSFKLLNAFSYEFAFLLLSLQWSSFYVTHFQLDI